MENRGDVKSKCKGLLLHNSGRNSGVQALATDSVRMKSLQKLELPSGPTGHTGPSDDVAALRGQ